MRSHHINWYRSRHLLLLIFVTLWVHGSTARCDESDSQEFQRFQQKKFLLEDRFQEDTKGNYQIKGDIAWAGLEIEMPLDTSLTFVKTIDGTFQHEIDLWPGEFKPKEQSISQINLHLANGWRVAVTILRRHLRGKIYRQVFVTEINGQQPLAKPIITELRRTPAFALPGDIERWAIKYHYGVIELSCGSKKICTTYTNAFSSWLNGITLSQQKKGIVVSRFKLVGRTIGYSDAQRKLFNDIKELRLQAQLAADVGDLSRSLKIEKKIIPLAEKCNGRNSFINGIFHQTIGERLGILSLHEESKESHEKSAHLFRSHLGKMHPETLQAEMYVAENLVAQGGLSQGLAAMRRVAVNYTRISGVNARNTQGILSRFIRMIRMQAGEELQDKDYDDYQALFTEALVVSKKAYPGDHWEVNDAQYDLEFAKRLNAATGQELEKLEEYIRLGTEVFTQGEEVTLGVDNERKDLLLSLTREIHGNVHPRTATALLAFSIDRFNQGEADVSLSMLNEAIKIFEQLSSGEGDARSVYASGRLGAQLSMMNRYAEASELLENACRKLQELNHDKKVEYADILLEYGRHLIRLGEHNQAEKYLQNAFQLYRSLGQPAHPNALKTCERLADVYRAKGATRQAQDILNYQRNMVLSAYSKKSSQYVDVLSSEARLSYMRKKYDDAIEKYKDATELIAKKYGKKSQAYEAVLNGLIDVYIAKGDAPAVIKHFSERLELELYRREALFNVYSEQDQLSQSLVNLYALNPLILLTLDGHMQPEQSYYYAIAYKGAVTAWQRVARIARRDPQIKGYHEELKNLESQIATMENQGTVQDHKSHYNKLISKRDRLESKLLNTNRDYQIASKQTSVADLLKLLPSGTTLIDFYEYEKPKGFWDKAFFRQPKVGLVAFVVNKENGVRLVELGSAPKVYQAWLEWQAAMEIEPYYELQSQEKTLADLIDEQGELLRELVWDPLVEHLAEADTVIISPSPLLSACPFAALPAPQKGSYLIEQYAFATITTPRLLPELLVPRETAASAKLLLVGDIDYNASLQDQPSSAFGVMRTTNSHFSKLPKADQELRPILKAYIQRFDDINLKQLRRKEATETMLRKHIAGADYIHLHTHGFCLSSNELQEIRSGQRSKTPEENPWMVSGIALAGANHGIYAQTPTDSDGILWSAEIEQLDFSQAELVTLSACQTAIGNLVLGEGMLGSQRALHVAGARSSLTALWSVNDTTTKVLMQKFYEQIWKQKLPKAKALQQAMIYMLREYDWQKKSQPESSSAQRTPPTLWAGFVLHGDWR